MSVKITILFGGAGKKQLFWFFEALDFVGRQKPNVLFVRWAKLAENVRRLGDGLVFNELSARYVSRLKNYSRR